VMRLIKCDLCTTTEEKPHGGPPEGWRSYSKKQGIDLCLKCAKDLHTYLGSRGKAS
jgi:hypothetical protein